MAKILFHFGEMSLKGKNRKLFEKRMARNIRGALKGVLLPTGCTASTDAWSRTSRRCRMHCWSI